MPPPPRRRSRQRDASTLGDRLIDDLPEVTGPQKRQLGEIYRTLRKMARKKKSTKS